MDVAVHLRPDAAAAVQSEEDSASAREVLATVEGFGLALQATHPQHPDPALRTHFIVEAPDERAEEVAETLRRLDAVEAAYTKPPAAP